MVTLRALCYQEPSTLCMTGCLCFVRFSVTVRGRHLYLGNYCGENINNGIPKTDEAQLTVLDYRRYNFLWGEGKHAVLKDDFICGLRYYAQSPVRRVLLSTKNTVSSTQQPHPLLPSVQFFIVKDILYKFILNRQQQHSPYQSRLFHWTRFSQHLIPSN